MLDEFVLSELLTYCVKNFGMNEVLFCLDDDEGIKEYAEEALDMIPIEHVKEVYSLDEVYNY